MVRRKAGGWTALLLIITFQGTCLTGRPVSLIVIIPYVTHSHTLTCIVKHHKPSTHVTYSTVLYSRVEYQKNFFLHRIFIALTSRPRPAAAFTAWILRTVSFLGSLGSGAAGSWLLASHPPCSIASRQNIARLAPPPEGGVSPYSTVLGFTSPNVHFIRVADRAFFLFYFILTLIGLVSQAEPITTGFFFSSRKTVK